MADTCLDMRADSPYPFLLGHTIYLKAWYYSRCAYFFEMETSIVLVTFVMFVDKSIELGLSENVDYSRD